MTIHNLAIENEKPIDSLRQDVKDLKNNISDTKGVMSRTIQDAKNVAKQAVDQSLSKIKNSSNAAQQNVSSYVQEKPFKTLLWALLAGLITAKLVAR